MTTETRSGAMEREVETVLTASHSRLLHVAGDGEPLCSTTGDFVTKPLSVYPPAHRHWCRMCRRLWRRAHGRNPGEGS